MRSMVIKLLARFHNTSIRVKLIVIFILTINIPMLGISYISYTSSMNLILGEIQHLLLGLTSQINNNTEDWLKKMDNLTSLLYSSELLGKIMSSGKYEENSMNLLEDNREFDKLFMYIFNQSTEIESIFIFTVNKNVFYKSYAGPMKTNYTIEDETWYRETVAKNGKITFYGPHTPWLLSNSKTKVFSLAREIHDMDGKSLGVILIDIKLDSIRHLIEKTVSTYDSRFFIIDGHSNLIYHDDGYSTDSGQNKKTLNTLIGSGNYSGKGIIDNKWTYMTYRVSSYSGWHIISVTPESSINQRTNQLLRLNVIITLIAFIIFSFLIILLYLTIYRPINRLTVSMKKVESGDFSVKISETSKDEIGQLCFNFNNMVYKINKLIDNEYKTEILRKDAEFKALQAQINPHFLYNTLQLISSIAVVKKVPEINEASKSLGYMLRYSIKTKGDFVPFEQELDHVKSYISIQKTRMEDKVTVNITVNDSVFEYGIMKLVIQPFVENAFIHGIEKIKGKGLIELSVKLHGEYILIKIKDNGIGMDKEKLEFLKQSLNNEKEQPQTGGGMNIGIHNANSRLKLFYGSRYTLTLESCLGSGTEISVEVPAIKYSDR